MIILIKHFKDGWGNERNRDACASRKQFWDFVIHFFYISWLMVFAHFQAYFTSISLGLSAASTWRLSLRLSGAPFVFSLHKKNITLKLLLLHFKGKCYTFFSDSFFLFITFCFETKKKLKKSAKTAQTKKTEG